MNIRGIVIIALVTAGVFLAGRLTAPKYDVRYKQLIDSLERVTKENVVRASKYEDLSNYYRGQAQLWMDSAIHKRDKVKIITRTIYAQDTSRNRAMSVLQRDSVIRTIFLKN